MDELLEFRAAKDEVFREDPRSPLTDEQRARFTGLDYYPPEPALALELTLEPPEEEGELVIPTTDGGERPYRRVGVVRFDVDGEQATLTVFRSGPSPSLFLPFRDATSGRETYGAGRYLDLEPPENGVIRVDFNLAYNPYCAYNPRWVCPLPPPENWLGVPIRAGEKIYPDAIK